MATDLGKVGIVMKGTWSSSATYEALDAVSYNNGLYIAKQAVPANTAPTNTTYWQIATDVSSKADKVAGTSAGRIAALTGDGNLADSTRTLEDIASLWTFEDNYTDIDFDDLPYGVCTVLPAETVHAPNESEIGWIVLTVGGLNRGNKFKFQFALGYNAENIYARRCWGSWTTWKKLSST